MGPDAKPLARPSWLTTLAIFGVALGALGIVGGMNTLGQSRASAAKTEQDVAKAFERLPGMGAQPKEFRDAAKEAIPGMLQVDQRWKKRRIALASANILLSAMLLIGALQSLRLFGSGRWLWQNACLALMPVEVLGAVMQTFIVRDMVRVWVDALVKAGDVPQAAAQLAGASKVAVAIIAVLYGAWAILLCVYYSIALVRLSKPAARQLFEAAALERERNEEE
jgi:hypothetical protein